MRLRSKCGESGFLRRAGRAISLLAMVVAFAAPSTVRAQIEPIRDWIYASPVGVADGQYARLSAYFTRSAKDGELPPGPCRVTLRFVDGTGQTVAETVASLAASRASFVDFRPRGLRTGDRATVRAVIHAEPDAAGNLPQLIPSLEVVDVSTGRDAVTSPGTIVGFNPQPDPPRELGIVYLASMQVARVSASYVDLPSERGFPPGPCRATLTISNGDGNVIARKDVTLAPGETASLDFAAGSMVDGVRRRMWATVTTDGSAQGFITPSLEVFDQATGRSTTLLPANLVQSWGWE